jgi:hypothetical protein
MIRKLIALTLFVSLLGTQAFASTCYTLDEAEAEQGIRIHSELMVIGLNCMNMQFRDGTNLYKKYNQFTVDNVDIFSSYEDKLLSYYQKQGDSDPEASLNTLRTRLANHISNSAARMKPDQFCNRYAGRLFKAADMDRSTIRKWASTIYPSHPVSRPLCEQEY